MTDSSEAAIDSVTEPEPEASASKSFMVFEYGLSAPREGVRRVLDQMARAHAYRNRLTEIEHRRRDGVRDATLEHAAVAQAAAEVEAAIIKLEQARGEIAQTRQKSRARSENAKAREVVRALADDLKQKRQRLKEEKRLVYDDREVFKARIKGVEEAANAQVKEARASCGVYWGTYLLAEQALDAARKSPTPPKFVGAFRGEGRVGVQLQGGMDVVEVTNGEDTRIRILPPARPRFHGRREGRGYKLQLRVGSDDRKRPVWAEWGLILHRPLPAKSIIKVATVMRRRRGPFWDWRLHLTLDVTHCDLRRLVPEDGAVALNLGFARRDRGGLRSGFVVGSDGWSTEVLCGKSDMYRTLLKRSSLWSIDDASEEERSYIECNLRAADLVRSYRDKDLDVLRGLLRSWIDNHRDALPAWLLEDTEHMAQWRSPNRFASLFWTWQMNWFEGGESGYDLLDAWRQRDMRLYKEQTHLRSSTLIDRREGYRILASWLASRYRYLVIDDTDLREFQQSPAPESDTTEIDAVKWQQRIAAGSILRQTLVAAFGASRIRKVSSVNITRLHGTCGHMMDRDDTRRIWTCKSCGAQVDQDHNACRNALQLFARDEFISSAAAKKVPGRAARLRAAAAVSLAARKAASTPPTPG